MGAKVRPKVRRGAMVRTVAHRTIGRTLALIALVAPIAPSTDYRSYFQLRDLPEAIHPSAVAIRRWRVSSVFAESIHSTYSRL